MRFSRVRIASDSYIESDPPGPARIVEHARVGNRGGQQEGSSARHEASAAGAEGDFRGLPGWLDTPSHAGVLMMPSNARAARLSALIAWGTRQRPRSWGGASSLPAKKKVARTASILSETLKVVSIGVSTFADDLCSQDVEVVSVDWKPPAGGDVEMKPLEKLGA